jgi:hypothetical protein
MNQVARRNRVGQEGRRGRVAPGVKLNVLKIGKPAWMKMRSGSSTS